jgi:hypothetical protein
MECLGSGHDILAKKKKLRFKIVVSILGKRHNFSNGFSAKTGDSIQPWVLSTTPTL